MQVIVLGFEWAVAGSSAVDQPARWMSAASLVLGLAGLIVATLSFRRDRVNVKVHVNRPISWRYIDLQIASAGYWPAVRVENRGRAPVELKNGWWEVKPGGRVRAINLTNDSKAHDESTWDNPLPMNLPGLSARDWMVRSLAWDPAQHDRSIYRVRYCLRLGNGKVVASPWALAHSATADIDPRAIDRAAFPRLWRPLREILRTKAMTKRHRERARAQRQSSKTKEWD